MGHPAIPITLPDEGPPPKAAEIVDLPVLDAEIVEPVDLDALAEQPLQHPPAVIPVCACGKNGTPEAHGLRLDAEGNVVHRALSCDEVLEIQSRVQADQRADERMPAWLPRVLPVLGVLLGLGAAVAVGWLLVVGVTALVTAVTAWFSANWPILAAIGVALLLLGGGGACAGLHCGGCRG